VKLYPEGGTLITVVVPKSGGVTSTKASVVRWLKHEGDRADRVVSCALIPAKLPLGGTGR